MSRGPGEAGRDVSGGDDRRGWRVRLRQYRHIQAGVECRAHAAGGAQGAAKRLGQRRQALIGGACGSGSLGARVNGTELTTDAIELHPHHLPMTNTAGEHIEQDAAIKHPGNERTIGTGEFHGAALYHQPPTKCLQKIAGRLSSFAHFQGESAMSFVVARWIVGVFTCISMVHLYWAAGGKLGFQAAIPQLPGEFASGPRPAFKPSALGTFLVALGLVAIALLVCLRAGLYFSAVSHGALQWGISAIAVVMFARAIGDSELVGFFKKVGGSRFARLDTYFYSPLCLVLGVGLLVVAWG